MTAIACYFQRELDVVYPWAVADSRVSQQTNVGYRTMHDHAVKVFSIPFQVGTQVGHELRSVYQGSFGFCYSGSSISGLNSHAAFSHLLRNLASSDGRLPKLGEIAEFVAGVLREYVHAYGIREGLIAICECAILGWCPVEQRPKIFTIRPTTDTTDGLLDFKIENLDPEIKDGYVLLGDAKEVVAKFIAAARARATVYSINWWRAPWHGLHDAIRSDKLPTIGGHIQLGLGVGRTFEVLARSETMVEGEKHGVPEFLGLELARSHWKVGPCELAMPKMGGLGAFPIDQYP